MSRKPVRLRLWVAARAPNSQTARRNLDALLAERGLTVELEVLDVFEHMDRARGDGVLVTPTLLRLAPPPALRVVGSLSDRAALLHALGGA